MKWTLIFCDSLAASPQVFHVECADPSAEARAMKREQEWLQDYALLAAVPGHHSVATRDDAHGFDECTLHMNGAVALTDGARS